MEEFTLINKQRNRIKVFKPFEDISKPSPSINAIRKQSKELLSARNGQKKQFPKLFLKKLANQQLKNLLMEPRRHLGFGGLELLSRLNKVNEHVILIHQIYF